MVEGQTEPSQTPPTTTTTSTTTSDASGQVPLPYAGIMVCAAILLVALVSSNKQTSHKNYEYGIAVASVAMCFSFLGSVVSYVNKPGTQQVLMYNNIFLFLWNFIGAGILTFSGPFDITGNGYFSSWGLVVFGVMALGVTATIVRQNAANHQITGPSMALLAASFVLMAAISIYGINKSDNNYAELVYSLIVTILTIVIVGGLMGKPQSTQAAELYAMLLLSILWIVAANLLTFRGPFLFTGNGKKGTNSECIGLFFLALLFYLILLIFCDSCGCFVIPLGYFAAWGGALASVFAVNAARGAA